MLTDDLGHEVALPDAPARVVSLVPSLTEALAASCPEKLVGATDWCTHPADLDVTRVRGTKNPDLDKIRGLAPDLVIANMEENRELDVRRLRESGIAVWVTRTESVDEALATMRRLFAEVLDVGAPAWLLESERLWGATAPEWGSVAVPIWRDPWMVVGRETFTGDLLRKLGLRNVFERAEGRYPQVEVDEILAAAPDLVLLPDEPYEFCAADGPEAFPGLETRLLEGRWVTWYGPAMVEAHRGLEKLLGRPTIY